ncbi:hypothetical protein VTO73DRAFT_5423 [Trametes versicolor]
MDALSGSGPRSVCPDPGQVFVSMLARRWHDRTWGASPHRARGADAWTAVYVPRPPRLGALLDSEHHGSPDATRRARRPPPAFGNDVRLVRMPEDGPGTCARRRRGTETTRHRAAPAEPRARPVDRARDAPSLRCAHGLGPRPAARGRLLGVHLVAQGRVRARCSPQPTARTAPRSEVRLRTSRRPAWPVHMPVDAAPRVEAYRRVVGDWARTSESQRGPLSSSSRGHTPYARRTISRQPEMWLRVGARPRQASLVETDDGTRPTCPRGEAKPADPTKHRTPPLVPLLWGLVPECEDLRTGSYTASWPSSVPLRCCTSAQAGNARRRILRARTNLPRRVLLVKYSLHVSLCYRDARPSPTEARVPGPGCPLTRPFSADPPSQYHGETSHRRPRMRSMAGPRPTARMHGGATNVMKPGLSQGCDAPHMPCMTDTEGSHAWP